MFNFDIFPESSYDDTTGEYSADFNFEPVPVDDVKLTGDITAQVFTIGDENEGHRVAELLREFANAGLFEPVDNPRNPKDYPPIPDNLDRTNSRTVRGPFTKEGVEKFLDDTGLRGIGEPFYDEAFDEFWVEIDTG